MARCAGPTASLRDRCVRLASALAARGIGRGDTVAALLPNTPEMLECHYGVPMAGAVLNTINTRLDADTIAYILDHGEAKAIIVDREFSPCCRRRWRDARRKPLVIEVADPEAARRRASALGGLDYEAMLAEGDPDFAWALPADEWDAIALNYTSGTTGEPKGVVYHHRGAQLLATGNVLFGQHGAASGLSLDPADVPLQRLVLPLDGLRRAGTHVCLRAVRGATMWALMAEHGVTHMCGAPVVMSTLLDTPAGQKRPLPQRCSSSSPPRRRRKRCWRR